MTRRHQGTYETSDELGILPRGRRRFRGTALPQSGTASSAYGAAASPLNTLEQRCLCSFPGKQVAEKLVVTSTMQVCVRSLWFG